MGNTIKRNKKQAYERSTNNRMDFMKEFVIK